MDPALVEKITQTFAAIDAQDAAGKAVLEGEGCEGFSRRRRQLVAAIGGQAATVAIESSLGRFCCCRVDDGVTATS